LRGFSYREACQILQIEPKKRDSSFQLLRRTPVILFCPDFDKAGAIAWSKWKKMFSAIQRILTPDGKSVGDAYLAGVDLRLWILESLSSSINYKVIKEK
jgi:hypothetical protein